MSTAPQHPDAPVSGELAPSTRVGVAVFTLNAESHLPRCLPPLLESPCRPRVLVVDSSSTDRSAEIAAELGAETLVIPRAEFNHGATRERARKLLGTDVVVMMSQDAYPVDPSMVDHLAQPILEGRASMAYARQLPREDAPLIEQVPRRFSYPPGASQVRGLEDLPEYGAFTYFCSNACCAWSNSALDDIGGFRTTLTAEDQIASASLVRKGYKVAYVAEAEVLHSHESDPLTEFHRYFDFGYAWTQFDEVFAFAGSQSGRGGKLAKTLLLEVLRRKPWMLPWTIANIGARWLGFKLGGITYKVHAPLWLKKALSSQNGYWVHHDDPDRPKIDDRADAPEQRDDTKADAQPSSEPSASRT